MIRKKLERDHQSSIVKSSGSKRTKANTIHCYSCNRSGSHVSKSRGKRQIKSHGTSKIEHHCIAQLTVTIYI